MIITRKTVYLIERYKFFGGILRLHFLDLLHFLVKGCLYGLLKIIKLMLILGQVRLSKGYLFPAGLGEGLG